MKFIWENAPSLNEISAGALSEYGLDPTAAALIVRRLEQTGMTAEEYLNPGLQHLHTPKLFDDMNKALTLIRSTIRAGEMICVHGDYDADGITATALLVNALKQAGGVVTWYIPHRMNEGYGLSCDTIGILASQDAKLIITVDCGITAFAPVEKAHEMGIKIIITDHHVPEKELPLADAILNPKCADYPFPHLAGVGVAFKLAQALTERIEDAFLSLAAFGTVADVVSLTGENRTIVAHGLKKMNTPFFKTLARYAGLKNVEITSTDVGYRMAPRINALGRLHRAQDLIPLFFERDEACLEEGINSLEQVNKERRSLEKGIAEEARAQVEKVPLQESYFLIASGENWHKGVLGIVASRISDEYYRPALVMSLEGEYAKGSGRSIPGIDLLELLRRESALFERLGGHSQAVGFTIKKENISLLRKKMNEILEEWDNKDFIPRQYPDIRLAPSQVTRRFIESLARMEPFGADNPRPLVVIEKAVLLGTPVLAGQDHLKFSFQGGEEPVNVIGFFMGSEISRIISPVHLLGFPEIGEFNGSSYLQFRLLDYSNVLRSDEDLRRSRFIPLYRFVSKRNGVTRDEIFNRFPSPLTGNYLKVLEEMDVLRQFGDMVYSVSRRGGAKQSFESSTLYSLWKEELKR